MRSCLVVVACLCSACLAAPLPTDNTPSPVPVHGVPATLDVIASPGVGSAGGMATVTAVVRDGYRAPVVGLLVTFEASAGTIGGSATTNDKGLALTTVTAAPGTLTVIARAAGLDAKTLVAIQPKP